MRRDHGACAARRRAAGGVRSCTRDVVDDAPSQQKLQDFFGYTKETYDDPAAMLGHDA
jgi:hypothetical protein